MLHNAEKRSDSDTQGTQKRGRGLGAHTETNKIMARLLLVGEGLSDLTVKRTPEERAAMLNLVTPANVENQPPILPLHSPSVFRLSITIYHSPTHCFLTTICHIATT